MYERIQRHYYALILLLMRETYKHKHTSGRY
jgi:hypothetical protein